MNLIKPYDCNAELWKSLRNDKPDIGISFNTLKNLIRIMNPIINETLTILHEQRKNLIKRV